MLEDYKNALKSGQRAYRACVARGQSPSPHWRRRAS